VPDFPRDVQPILDRHCAGCHNPDRPDGRVVLSGDRTPLYSQSYWTIVKRRLISDGRNGFGNRPPRSIGSSASPLVGYLDGSHYGAKLSPRERMQVILWIEAGATYPGTYASYFSGMVEVDFPLEPMIERCGSCHGVQPNSHRRLAWEGDDIRPWAKLPLEFGDQGPAQSLVNLTRPRKSPLLLAPLASEAGGYGLCSSTATSGPGPAATVFADGGDPVYQAMLAAIADAGRRLSEIKRFDMPGFRPNEHYLREMKRFGILLPDQEADDPIDVYAADQAFWRSAWHQPAESNSGQIR